MKRLYEINVIELDPKYNRWSQLCFDFGYLVHGYYILPLLVNSVTIARSEIFFDIKNKHDEIWVMELNSVLSKKISNLGDCNNSNLRIKFNEYLQVIDVYKK